MSPDWGDWFGLPPDEVRIDSFTTGRHTHVRCIHIPTGLVASCSQYEGTIRNRHHALKELS
jgi:protein subunit release factor A